MDTQVMTLSSNEDISERTQRLLFSLGYSPHGSVQGLESFKEEARSGVSDVVGRMDKANT